MADDDKSLWDSANDTDLPEQEAHQIEVAQEQPVETPETPRDERGRFAPKTAAEEAAEHEETVQAQPEARETSQGIPSWRLKEEAEARRAAEERAANHERELADLRRQFAAIQKQNEPQQPVPDIFEDAAGFVDHRNQEAINPVKNQINELREFYSQRDAVREHGAEKVTAAYKALDQALRSRDPEANAVYQRAMQSLDPYGDIMTWHRKQTMFSTIGPDPEAFVQRRLDEMLADPAAQAKLLERIRGAAQGRPSTVTALPPSLNRATSAAPPGAEGDDDSEAGLLQSALRR